MMIWVMIEMDPIGCFICSNNVPSTTNIVILSNSTARLSAYLCVLFLVITTCKTLRIYIDTHTERSIRWSISC